MEVVIFVVVTIGIVAVSWRSLLHPRSHGFWRFFVFEGVLLLMVLNAHAWFRDPLSVRQLVSWVLLTASAILPILGLRELRVAGRPRDEPAEDPEFKFERTSRLVRSGVYRFIRHPMYASLFYLAWGAFLKEIQWLTLAVAGLTTFFVFMTARMEERELLGRFGEGYAKYMRETSMFIPYLW